MRENTLESLYDLIASRKASLPEGSYTTYLFTKGLDKILKKVGEEASEVIIASKNDDKQELVGEMTDLLYHVMVLMVEKGVTGKDILDELGRREGKLSKTQDRPSITNL